MVLSGEQVLSTLTESNICMKIQHLMLKEVCYHVISCRNNKNNNIHLLIKSDKFRVRWHNVIVTVYWESNLTEWQPGMHPSVLLLFSQSPHREWKTESVISIHAIRGSMFKLMWTGGGKKS